MTTFLTGQSWLWPTLATLAILLSVFAVTPPPTQAAQSAQGSSPEEVARAWVDAVNTGETEAAIALYADDAVIHFLGKEVVGKEAIAQRQRNTIAPMLKPSLQILDVAVEGDTARVRLRGENSVTRWDQHAPVINDLSFSVREGKIYREVGPILSAADTTWYVDAQKRFTASRAQAAPSSLPKAGDPAGLGGSVGLVSLAAAGIFLVTLGVALRWRTAPRRRSSR